MSIPILATKLYIPPYRPELVSRTHLIERLNKGFHHKITLISAPAGFGKTTLVSEWIAKSQRPAAWLSLDQNDNNFTRFLSYLIVSLQTIQADIGAGVLNVLQSPPEIILTALLNEMATLQDELMLILDDYHLIDNPIIDEALTFLVEHLPPQIHLVIITREDPQLPLARLRARGQLTELRVADLRFTLSEIAGFLNELMGLQLNEADIAALETRTEGWIAGLQLAAISMQGHSDAHQFIQSFTGSHRFVLDYLVEEVLHQQSPAVQTFLLYTSILGRFCGSLCDAVLLETSSRATLEYLEQANLFLIPLDNQRQWYRYHHLFADVLHARVVEEQAQQISALHQRASAWYEQNGLLPDAIYHALAAQDFEQTARLLELIWPAIDASFQTETWLNWVGMLPNELINTRPILIVGYAWSLINRGEFELAENRLQEAERWLKADSKESLSRMVVSDEEQFRWLSVSIATARAYSAQSIGDTDNTVKYAKQVIESLPEANPVKRGAAITLLGLTYWAKGDLESAHQAFTEFISVMRSANNIDEIVGSIFVLADMKMALGRLHSAISLYEQTLELAINHTETPLLGTEDLYRGLSELYCERNELEIAADYLAKSEKLGQQISLPNWKYRLCIAQARLKEAQGDLKGALDRLDAAEQHFMRTPLPDVRPSHALKARIWILQGRLAEAIAWANERGLSIEDDLNYLQEAEHIVLARLLLAHNNEDSLSKAIYLLERLQKNAEADNRIGNLLEILIVLALVHQLNGDMHAALSALERALKLAEPEGFIRIFVENGKVMGQLLFEAARHGITPHYVAQLLAAFELDQPNETSHISQGLIEPLSERELEVLQLVAQGLSNEQISKRLFVALNTIKGHNRRIFGKLQAQNRTEAVVRARELGLIQ